jgi:putative transposase
MATATAQCPPAGQPERLIERMRVLHQQTREAYGARKMWQLLNREGLSCGRHQVARLRRLAGIVAVRRRRYVRTVHVRQHETPAIPNRLNQQFAVSEKNRVWTTRRLKASSAR